MGAFLSTTKQQRRRVLMNGLDGSGKTTILYKWKLGGEEVVHSIPTIGFNVEELCVSPKKSQGRIPVVVVEAWDVGGRDKARALWRHYYQQTECVVFVVDSSNIDRMDQVYDEVHQMTREPKLVRVPFLILCNKQDLANALSPHDISQRLELKNIKDRRVAILGLSAISGKNNGLEQALTQMADLLSNPEPQWGDSHDVSLLSERTKAALPDRPDYALTENQGNVTLQRFAPIKNQTECPFAKSAKLWGGKSMEEQSAEKTRSLEHQFVEQAKANNAALCHFVHCCRRGERLDGFCLELDHADARGTSVALFGHCVYLLLKSLSDLDPCKEFVMRVQYIGARGWRFRFAGMDFFVTSFAPCYPCTQSICLWDRPSLLLVTTRSVLCAT